MQESPRPPGRPRSAESEQRILDAALRLLSTDGYARMSIDAVAVEAGVSKPTIYRRWTTKADLATAAVRGLRLSEPAVDTGSTPSDLIGILDNFRRSLLRPNGMSLIGTVLSEEAHTPELLALFRERLVAPRRAMLRAVLERGRKRGELRREVDLDCVTSALVGAFYARYLAASKVPADFARQVVDMIWRGIAA
ncbi:MAG: TetR/AcrR family transcriptional regulator [Bryobacteraceae bacterium]